MSNISNDMGRAFEYACIIELQKRISAYRPVIIKQDSVTAALKAWNNIDNNSKNTFKVAASAYIDTLFKVEPLILECENKETDILELSINRDSDAEGGDVRDIVIKRGCIRWDIGLSMKHNHFAAKHSRLSNKNDFGNKWYGIPCSKTYWSDIQPVFSKLQELKKTSVKWEDMDDKEQSVYIPLLKAFIDEIKRAYEKDSTVPSKLLSYLLGTRDFYKVVAIDKKAVTEFQAFNLRGELNKNGKYNKAKIIIPTALLPTEIICIRMKPDSTNTVELYLNNGWSLSFRIHNASKIIEPSLKFDIQFIGIPSSIISINCKWE